ncbi:MAG: hypothetical protein AB1428_10925 [Bacteroidota bacterium]
MRRYHCVTLFVVIAAVASTVHAQVILPEKGREGGVREQVFGLGFAGGAATGVGLSFRHHLPGSWSYEITGGIIKVDDKTSYAVGGELQYDLVRADVSRFFVAGGMGYYYSGRGAGNGMAGPGRIGLGVGGELPMASGFHVSGELLFTYFTDGTVLPLPQAGIHYYFY